jgi:hypothetical protein
MSIGACFARLMARTKRLVRIEGDTSSPIQRGLHRDNGLIDGIVND